MTIHIEFTNEQGTTVRATAPDERMEEVLARAQVRIFGEPCPKADAAEAKRWTELQARWNPVEKPAKKGRR